MALSICRSVYVDGEYGQEHSRQVSPTRLQTQDESAEFTSGVRQSKLAGNGAVYDRRRQANPSPTIHFDPLLPLSDFLCEPGPD
ncbi:hypothetical protein AVEN_139723-1 [Araneus ventricosus]|uniref:Uncharacterized protein n=1 Tax=Araneus ventricosus TaxID=182803 RepID=A0A4Y2IKZ5_ARAVE|nr:hypothetical protein AVEN_139723-1 [Araneus ventricosus]